MKSLFPLPALLFSVLAMHAQAQSNVSLVPSSAHYASGGGTISFSVTLDYPASTRIVGLRVLAPNQRWTYVSTSGATAPQVTPEAGQIGDTGDGFGFLYYSLPLNQAKFTYSLRYAAGLAEPQGFSVVASFTDDNGLRQTVPVALVISPPPTTPVITSHPANTFGSIGGTASFSVVATGTAPFTFQWRRNNLVIAGATQANLTLTNLTSADAGTYSVTITNTLGSVTSRGANLTAVAGPTPPSISRQPASLTVQEGGKATLTVSASGTGPLTYQWYKDGKAIAGAVGSTYSITKVLSSHAGPYSVVVSNSAGPVTSSASTLTVTPADFAPTLSQAPANTAGKVGGSATFTVAASGNPAPTYQWRKNGQNITGATRTTLTLSGLKSSDTGTYDVAVTNRVGSVISPIARLEVSAADSAPVFKTQPAGQTAALGHSVTLTASATAVPAPTYQWFRNGAALAGATSASLTFGNVQASDAATYTVVATNSVGSTASQSAKLGVVAPEIIGTYVGTIGSVGTFALQVGPDNTASFLGYTTGTKSAVVGRAIAITAEGRFAFTLPLDDGRTTTTSRAAPEITFEGTLGLTGSLQGTARGAVSGVLSATRADTQSTSDYEGFYEATSTNAASTTGYAIIGSSGEAYVVIKGINRIDAGSGSLDPTGNLSLRTAAGQSVTGTVAATTSLISLDVKSDHNPATKLVGATADVLASQRLINISTRARVGAGASAVVSGFVISGHEAKSVLIRAVGPTLSQFGVTGVLQRPQMEIISGSTLIASNTGWSKASNAEEVAGMATRVGAFALPEGSADAALILTLAPGTYTVNVTGADGGEGIVLLEVYDLAVTSQDQKFVNISTRATVGAGDNVCVAGFVVSGLVPKRFLIRGVGPSLKAYLSGALAKPRLQLFQGANLIAQNAGWSTATNAAQIAATARSTGAFTLTSNDDAAILVSLEPGQYTAQISDASNSSGIALIEVYEAP